jgi:hypothetical protein
MEYKVIEQNQQGTLIEMIINDKPYCTLVVASEAEFESAVESFYNTVANPKDFTQINLQAQLDKEAKKESGKAKLSALGLDEDEINAIIGTN